jgi:hypothetical protein
MLVLNILVGEREGIEGGYRWRHVQNIRILLHGPHLVKVHTEVPSQERQREEDDRDHRQKTHSLVHLVRFHLEEGRYN